MSYSKFVSFLIALVLICSSSFAFADDAIASDSSEHVSEAETFVLPDSQLLTLEASPELVSFDNELRSASVFLASDSSHDANDIYNLLYTIFLGSGGSGYVQSRIYSQLTTLMQSNEQIKQLLVPNTGETSPITAIRNILANIYGCFYNDSEDAYYLDMILNAIESNNSSTDLHDILLAIRSNGADLHDATGNPFLYQILTSNQSILSQIQVIVSLFNSLNSSVSTVNSSLTSISRHQLSFFDTNHSDLSNIYSKLDDIYSSLYVNSSSSSSYYLSHFAYRNFSFLEYGDYPHTIYSSGVNSSSLSKSVSLDQFVGGIFPRDIFLNSLVDNILTIHTGLSFSYRQWGSKDLRLYGTNSLSSGSPIFLVSSDVTYTNNNNNISIVPSGNTDFFIDFSSVSDFGDYSYYFLLVYESRGSFSYLPAQPYVISPYIISESVSTVNLIYHIDSDLHESNSILNRFKDLYASDDLIEAKENQQALEDNIVDNFTGSGGGSVTLNDSGGLLNTITSVKSGLSDGGGSVSDVLSVFSGDTGNFWVWFSRSNYDAINTLYSPASASVRMKAKALNNNIQTTPSFIDDSLFSDDDVMGYYDIELGGNYYD